MSSSALLTSIGHPSEIAALLRWKLSGKAHAAKSLSGTTTPTSPKSRSFTSNGTNSVTSSQSNSSGDLNGLAESQNADLGKQSPNGDLPPLSDTATTWERCEYYLFLTSRSFAVVISELNATLRTPTALFYLVLRGLDTVEDDMTLDPAYKISLLENFYTFLSDTSWTFDGISQQEKDRALLVDFTCVTKELAKLDNVYQEVITDITKRMGKGMAMYISQEDSLQDPGNRVKTIQDYNEYCYYVAGLVGEGLTRLFLHSTLEPDLVDDPPHVLSVHMGLFLQKTNIIRDFKEDTDEFRVFWPREIWSNHVPSGKTEDLVLMKGDEALACLNDMIKDAIGLVPDVLDYLSMLRDRTVFRFCAIPQVMAVTSLALLFNNPEVFSRNVKIRRGLTVKLMYETQSMKSVAKIFRREIQNILGRGDLAVDVVCGKAIAACDTHIRRLSSRKPLFMLPLDEPTPLALVVLLIGVFLWLFQGFVRRMYA